MRICASCWMRTPAQSTSRCSRQCATSRRGSYVVLSEHASSGSSKAQCIECWHPEMTDMPVQAKTHEKVDSLGENRSIAVHAVCMLIRKDLMA